MATKPTNTERVHLDDWTLLMQLSQMLRTASDTYITQIDVPRGQAGVLCTIVEQDGMTQSEIADALSIQGATVTNMVKRLEEAGLVVRRRDLEDNRLVRVYLTDTGRETEYAINAKFAELQESIFKGIEQEERALLRKFIRKIIVNIT